jgi:hypothetical protein
MISIRKFEGRDYHLIYQFYERAVVKDEIERKATAFEWDHAGSFYKQEYRKLVFALRGV